MLWFIITKFYQLAYKDSVKITGKELEALELRRKQAVEKNQDITQLDSYIEDIKENINYVQEIIAETQHNVMDIEKNLDPADTAGLEQIIASVYDVEEAKYIIQKLYNMTLAQSHAVAQRDAKLRENEANLAEVSKILHWVTIL